MRAVLLEVNRRITKLAAAAVAVFTLRFQLLPVKRCTSSLEARGLNRAGEDTAGSMAEGTPDNVVRVASAVAALLTCARAAQD